MGKRMRCAVMALALILVLPGVVSAGSNDDFRQGVTSANKGDMDSAIAAFTRIIDSGAGGEVKNLASAYNLRGMCQEAKNDLQKALADYSKAIELDAKMAEALGNRAMLYVKLGDEAKAKEDAVAAKRIDRKVKVPEFK